MKKYIYQRWKENLLAGFFLCFNVLSSVLYSFVFMDTIDAITAKNEQQIIQLLVYQVILWIVIAMTYYLGGICKGKAQKCMQNDMRSDINTILIQKNYQEYEKHTIGDYISWYSNDVAQMDMWAFNSFFALITCIAQILITMVSLCLIHWVLVVVTMVGGIFLVLISVVFEKKITEKAKGTSKASEIFYSSMKNLLSGLSVMKNYHILEQFKKQSEECSEKKSEASYQYTKIQVTSNGCLLFCDAMFRVIVIGLCAFFIFQGKLELSAIVGVSNFIPKIFDGLTDALCYKNSILAAKPYFEKFEKQLLEQKTEILALEEKQKDNEKQVLKNINKRIDIKNLGYSYGEKSVFEHMNFQIQIGKKYALVGSSGSGKTTLMKILLGQLEGYKGEILFDNVNIKQYNAEMITDKIAYIEQNVYLFDTTIRNNITLWGNFSDEQIEKALKESALFDDMQLFPKGLETEVGENGKNLSGGQKQRIAVARALIYGKQILFVDEGTSALDEQNAKKIEEELLKNENLTLLLISHHLDEEQKQKFDNILELKNTKSFG